MPGVPQQWDDPMPVPGGAPRARDQDEGADEAFSGVTDAKRTASPSSNMILY